MHAALHIVLKKIIILTIQSLYTCNHVLIQLLRIFFSDDDDMGESTLDKPLGELLKVFLTVIHYYYIICNS